jgi:DNA-binding CsgD family transcriptional regulator
VRPLDFIGAIELAYDRSEEDAAWLEALTRAVGPAFSHGSAATSAYFFHFDDAAVDLGTTVSIGERPLRREDYRKQHEAGASIGPPRRVYECDMFTVLSRVVGAVEAKFTLEAAGMLADDALGLRANMTPESGALFTTHVPLGFRIRQRSMWTRLAAHVGAALRLRRTRAEPEPESALAVLSPRGRLEHGTAETIAARDELANAAKDIDRARGKMRRLDPDAACALWRTMVRGEWSLVDWLDHDGKRFLLVQDNRILGEEPRALTEREHQVVACAAMGHSNKLIAYDLGLSTGTVSVLLGRAAKKLGVSGRVALIRALREESQRAETATTSASRPTSERSARRKRETT